MSASIWNPGTPVVSSGSTGQSLQAAIDYLYEIGGGTVLADPGINITASAPIIVRERVLLDFNNATLTSYLSGTNDYGVNIRSFSGIQNGKIRVVSSGTPGTQAGIRAPVMVGALAGAAGTVDNVSAAEFPTNWFVRNMDLHTDADGKVAIQVNGGASNFEISDIYVPDSDKMFGVVHLDWNFVGTVESSNVPLSRANFDAGTAYTTHPNNGIIRNIKFGALSRAKTTVDTGSHGIRLSGAYNIRVENVVGKQTTYAAVRITAGDLGFEFAPAAIKPLAMKGIVIKGVAVENTTDSWGIYADSYADNVATAVAGGYVPLLDPLQHTDLEICQVTCVGSNSASVLAGLWLIQLRGGKFTDIEMSKYLYGVLVDEFVQNVDIHGKFHKNRSHGIKIHHPTNEPEDVRILPGTECFSNGQDATVVGPAGIWIEGSLRTRVSGALLGHRTAAEELTQERGIRVASTAAVDFEIVDNKFFSVETGGIALSILSGTDYGLARIVSNNWFAPAIVNKYSGVNILPVAKFVGPDGVERGRYSALRASLSADTTPTGGTWVAGDTIDHANPTGSNTGTRCTVGGTPGTWGLY